MKLIISLFRIIFLLMISIHGYAGQKAHPNQTIVIQPYVMSQYDQVIHGIYAKNNGSRSENITHRILADTNNFIGKPYVLGALGEGKTAKFDKDPIYRTDEFDCTTFCSTALALIKSNNFKQFQQHILAVRYENGHATYLTRNHFISVDWNVNNERKGYLTDVTESLFPKVYNMATAVINKPKWYAFMKANNLKQFKKLDEQQGQEMLNQLHALGTQTQVQVSKLPYVPLSALYDKQGKANMSLFNRIPSGVIIEIVRPNWNIKKFIGTNLNISHMGLGLRIHHQLIYREASSLENKVIDIPLTNYLKAYLHSPTIKGIHIEKINLAKS